MIRNEAEYQHASARLMEERNRLNEHRARLKGAGMTDEETARTADLLLGLAGRHSIVVVEHDMDFVHSIARTVTVLHEGSVLAEGTMDKVRSDDKVVEVYLGR